MRARLDWPLLFAALAGPALVLSALPGHAQPYRPADDSDVLVELPATRAPKKASLEDPVAAAQEARRLVELTRSSGDPRFLGYAEAVLQPWMTAEAPPVPILLLRATLRQARHDFSGALNDLDRLLTREPRNAQAWLTRATILRVQGRFAEAAEACARLKGVADVFVADLCRWAVRGSRGELALAAQALEAMVPAGRRAPRAVRTWFAAERGEQLARLGRLEDALGVYSAAMFEGLGDPLLRAELADVLLQLGRPEDVLALANAAPNDELLGLRVAIAARALGQPRAELEVALADFHAAARRRGEGEHLREEARYELEIRRNPKRALVLARENWGQQREAADAFLLLKAARLANSPGDVAAVRDWLQATGFEDARLTLLLADAPP